jgi:hypothetical protein
MDQGSFGAFAQQMCDVGLVFNIRFSEEELLQLPSWRLFNGKITDGVSSLPGRINLPARPPGVSESVNSTVWTFVRCFSQTVRGRSGRQKYHLVPPNPMPTSKWTLNFLVKEFSVINPISGPDDTPVPQDLIIIGGLLLFILTNTCI